MAQVYDQQTKLAGASPDGEQSGETEANKDKSKADDRTAAAAAAEQEGGNESDVSEDDGGDELPCKSLFL